MIVQNNNQQNQHNNKKIQKNNNINKNNNNRNNHQIVPSTSTNTNRPLRVVTHNVQGLTDLTKQKQLLDTLHLDHIDIIGLFETKLNTTASKYIFRNNKHYKAFFNNDSDSPMGSGVGIIISNEYAKYVTKVHSYKGRLIYIDLHMKGKIKLRIIQVYLPASTSGLREYTLDLYNCIEKTIIDATRVNARIILMVISTYNT